MSQRHLPFGTTSSTLGCNIILIYVFLAGVGFILLAAGLLASSGSLIWGSVVALLGILALSIALLVRWFRISAARADLLEESIAAQAWHHQAWVTQEQRAAEEYARAQEAQKQQEKKELDEKVATLSAILNLDAQDFEEAIGHLLAFLGYTDVTIQDGSTGERAVDIFCRDGAGKKTAVRIRQYDPDTEVEYAEVLQFVDAATARGQGIEHLVFVTTSSFTDAAVEAAIEKFDVTIMDAVELVEDMQQFRAAVQE